MVISIGEYGLVIGINIILENFVIVFEICCIVIFFVVFLGECYCCFWFSVLIVEIGIDFNLG